jgi:hypothetical protein
VSDGNFDTSKVFAYAYLAEASHSPHLYIRRTMEQVCGAPSFMVFGSTEERESIVAMSPIAFEGNTIMVEWHEEADNRFYAFYNVYAEITVVDFLLEHWEEPYARDVLGVIGNVCCIDPDCLLPTDFTSMRAMVRLDHDREVPEQLLVCNHSGPATLATVYTIRTWLGANPVPDFSDYHFGPKPTLHNAPPYHPVGNPPTQLPANLENLVATVLEWEIPTAPPSFRPVLNSPPTPYPNIATASSSTAHSTNESIVLALPWYGVGGVPLQEIEEKVEEEATVALAELSMEPPPVFSAEGHSEVEHESRA